MKCPLCGEKMIPGKVCSNGTLWWRQGTGDNVSLNDEGWLWRVNGARTSGYRCEKCKNIIIKEKS